MRKSKTSPLRGDRSPFVIRHAQCAKTCLVTAREGLSLAYMAVISYPHCTARVPCFESKQRVVRVEAECGSSRSSVWFESKQNEGAMACLVDKPTIPVVFLLNALLITLITGMVKRIIKIGIRCKGRCCFRFIRRRTAASVASRQPSVPPCIPLCTTGNHEFADCTS